MPQFSIKQLAVVGGVTVFALYFFPHLLPAIASGIGMFIVAAMVDIPTRLLMKIKIPRQWGVVISLILLFGIIATLGILLAPVVQQDVSALSSYSGKLQTLLLARINKFRLDLPFHTVPVNKNAISIKAFQKILSLSSLLHTTSITLLVVGVSVAGGIWACVSPAGLLSRLESFFSAKNKDLANRVILEVFYRTKRWLLAQLTLNLYVGVCSYVLFRITGVPFAGLFAIIAGFLEFVPSFGIILGAGVPAVLLFVSNPVSLFPLLIGLLVIHQLEDRFLIPVIMKKAVNIHQSIITLALFSFGLLWGIAGTVLAIPILGIAFTLVDELKAVNKESNT